jgi:hypothetical protein
LAKKKEDAVPVSESNQLVVLDSNRLAKLNTPTPKEFIYKREGRGGLVLDYVSIGYVINKLNEVFGLSWSCETVEVSNTEMLSKTGQVVVRVTLIVNIGDKSISRSQYGSAEIKMYKSGDKQGRPVDIGDDFKAAASDGLKKCASTLGVASDIYFRDWSTFEKQDTAEAPKAIAIPSEPSLQDEALAQARRDIYNQVKSLYPDKDAQKNLLVEVTGKESFMALTSGDINFLKESLV